MANCAFNYSGSKSDYPELHNITMPVVDLFGGGGGFWSNVKSSSVFVNDINRPLVEFQQMVYKMQQGAFDELIMKLYDLTGNVNSREEYEALRTKFNSTKNSILFMAVLSCCTNNMIRYNKSGGFNQTWGKRKFNASMERKLREFHSKISDKIVVFRTGRFDDIRKTDKALYFVDPPYLISGNFYGGWNEDDNHRLYDYLKGLRFVMTDFLKKGDLTNTILETAISDNGWVYTELRSTKMKAQRDRTDAPLEIIAADSVDTMRMVYPDFS